MIKTMTEISDYLVDKLKENSDYLGIESKDILADIDQNATLKAPAIIVFTARKPSALMHQLECECFIFLFLNIKSKRTDTARQFELIRDRLQKLALEKFKDIAPRKPDFDVAQIDNGYISGAFKFTCSYKNGAEAIL